MGELLSVSAAQWEHCEPSIEECDTFFSSDVSYSQRLKVPQEGNAV